MGKSKTIKLLCAFVLLYFPAVLIHADNQNETNESELAQNARTITGTVLDEANDPVIGASIMLKGTSVGTITDVDGRFILPGTTINANSEMQVSYFGYVTKNVKITPQANDYRIMLAEDVKALDEVVVIGYGVQKKSVVTAAISKVTAEDLENTIPTRIENVLKGKAAGVTITNSSGQPGAGSQVRIRGIGTINNSDPIYIVDGLAVGNIDYLNPTDIQSVEILKDAASAAIYGSRAANGVILVTTKTGKKNTKASINYDVSIGWQNPWKKKSILTAPWYQTILNEMQINDGNEPYFSSITTDNGTDWQDAIFNSNALVKSQQVSISGGTEKATYFLSLGYLDQEGIVGGNYDRSNYNRWTVRSNNTYNVFDDAATRKIMNKFTVGVNASYSRTKSKGIAENSQYYSPLGSALLMSPLVSVYADDSDAVLAKYPTAVTDKNGNAYSIPEGLSEIVNPVASLELPGAVSYSDRLTAGFWGELDLIKGLKFRSSYSADLGIGNTDNYSFPYYLSSYGNASSTTSYASSSISREFTWQVENTLNYDISFNNVHNLNVLLGQSAMEYTYKYVAGTGYNLPKYDPHKAVIDYTTGGREEDSASGSRSSSTLASYFGRVSYNYDERYMFQGTVRRDGSDKFGSNNKWAVFPSFSLGWNITNEAFMTNRPQWLANLKLRGSWGKNGNQQIGQFKYISTVAYGSNYTFGKGDSENSAVGVRTAGLANPDLKWEESEQIDVGLEMGFLNNALTFNIDYFEKKTNGMLLQRVLPSYIGTEAPWDNVGKMKNSGIELDLSYKFRISDVNLSFSGNISYLKNKLIDYGNESGFQNYDNIFSVGTVTRAENGQPFPFFYGYKTGGIFQTQQEVDSYVNKNGEKLQPLAVPGDVIFIDVDESGMIDDADRVKIGKGMPDFTFGFTIAADWRGFDFNAFFQGVAGNDIFDGTRRKDVFLANQPSWILDRWTGPGTSNKIPRLTIKDENNNWRSSDLYIKSGDYLRLKTLQLGYTLPSILTQKIYFQKIRIYIAGENLLTFTGYDGFDPEIASGGTSLGLDMGCYPQARTVSVGANITF